MKVLAVIVLLTVGFVLGVVWVTAEAFKDS